MDGKDESERQALIERLTSTLNSHGYSFQFSALKKARELAERNLAVGERSDWEAQAVEFPIPTPGDEGTRIDIVLKRRDTFPFYLLVECKRVNPALTWCFAKAPYTNARGVANSLNLEVLAIPEGQAPHAFGWGTPYSSLQQSYHVGLEVKNTTKGEASSSQGRGAIEGAATQILRGMNGMVSQLAANTSLLGGHKRVYFLPAIFTTADLWTTDVNLNIAPVETGDLTKADVEKSFRKRDWLLYQYMMSPGIKHALAPNYPASDLSDLMNTQYVRTIAIVSAAGIDDFLSWSLQISLE